MFIKRTIAGSALAAMLALLVPATPALADGAASTRNILLGVGAATYLIIQHNRKVHERYAEDARRQAALQSENNDAWAAYSSEKNAYANEAAEVADLKREVAYQHGVVVQQRNQLAMAARNGFNPQVGYVSPRRSSGSRQVAAHTAGNNSVAMISYGWGQI